MNSNCSFYYRGYNEKHGVIGKIMVFQVNIRLEKYTVMNRYFFKPYHIRIQPYHFSIFISKYN